MKTFINVRNICHYFSGLLNRYKIFLLQRATSDKNWSLQICLNFPSTPQNKCVVFFICPHFLIKSTCFSKELCTRCLPIELPGVRGRENADETTPPGEFFARVT